MPSFIRFIFWVMLSLFFKSAYAVNYQYTVNSGDVLSISVWKEESLQKDLPVLPDGTISFPLAGVVSVVGKSVQTIQTELTEKIAKYINDPVVNITVNSVGGNVIYILGQVKTPGRFVMLSQLDVMQALTLAGGLTPFAKANSIVILRRNQKESDAIKFEYSDLENGENLNKNYLLQSGDVIVVP